MESLRDALMVRRGLRLGGLGWVAPLACAVALVPLLGCDPTPPPPKAGIPPVGTIGAPRYDPAKPLPGQIPQSYPQQPYQPAPQYQAVPYQPGMPEGQQGQPQQQYVPTPQGQPQAWGGGFDPRIAAPPANQLYQPPAPAPGSYNDVPIVRDRPPEQRAFVDAYNRVGRPKIAVYMNRHLDGAIIDAGDGQTVATPLPAAGGRQYIKPGTADEAWAKNLDYEAVENILTDWIAAGGQTEVISPTLARARLTAEQRDSLEKGERFVLTDITQRLDADVFIQVQARPTRQTAGGLSIRLVAEALNARGGRSIGRAVVDVPPPLEKTTINEYTRFLARKLMDDMIGTWSNAAAGAPASGGNTVAPRTSTEVPEGGAVLPGLSVPADAAPVRPAAPAAQPSTPAGPPVAAPLPPANVVPPPR